MQPRICPASLPPPMASKAMVAPVITSASVRSARKLGALLSQTCVAPISRSSAACAGPRTMLTRATPSIKQMRLSICPRLDAAAVCTSALCPSRRMVSTMPSAVSGLTKHEAPSRGVAPAGNTRHCAAGMTRSVVYMPPPIMATALPSRDCAAASDPAAMTMPAPSLPMAMDWSMRPAMAFIAPAATGAVITGRALLPAALAWLMSAAPKSRPRSDGLMGDASTRTSTWAGVSGGSSTSTSESSSSPLLLIRVRISVVVVLMVRPGSMLNAGREFRSRPRFSTFTSRPSSSPWAWPVRRPCPWRRHARRHRGRTSASRCSAHRPCRQSPAPWSSRWPCRCKGCWA